MVEKEISEKDFEISKMSNFREIANEVCMHTAVTICIFKISKRDHFGYDQVAKLTSFLIHIFIPVVLIIVVQLISQMPVVC